MLSDPCRGWDQRHWGAFSPLGPLIGGYHADMRVFVGLQVHDGDVACFTIISVKNDKVENEGLEG